MKHRFRRAKHLIESSLSDELVSKELKKTLGGYFLGWENYDFNVQQDYCSFSAADFIQRTYRGVKEWYGFGFKPFYERYPKGIRDEKVIHILDELANQKLLITSTFFDLDKKENPPIYSPSGTYRVKKPMSDVLRQNAHLNFEKILAEGKNFNFMIKEDEVFFKIRHDISSLQIDRVDLVLDELYPDKRLLKRK